MKLFAYGCAEFWRGPQSGWTPARSSLETGDSQESKDPSMEVLHRFLDPKTYTCTIAFALLWKLTVQKQNLKDGKESRT